jgi:hypothetical protein
VYSREIDGNVLTLTTSGWTYKRQHVLFDLDTESFWFHIGGTNDLTCIAGHYADRILPGIESHYGPWHVWQAENPESMYLKAARTP